MTAVFWFISKWIFFAIIFLIVMWCGEKMGAKKNKEAIFSLKGDDKRTLCSFIILYMTELGYLYTSTETQLLDSVSLSFIKILDALLAIIMLLSSLVLAIRFKKHHKAQSRDKVGIIILLGNLQTALAMIVSNDNQSIITRLVSNIIYLALPAYVLYELSIQPFSKIDKNNKDGLK